MAATAFTVTITLAGASPFNNKHSECDMILQGLKAVEDDFGRGRGLKTSGDGVADVGAPNVASATWTYTTTAPNP